MIDNDEVIQNMTDLFNGQSQEVAQSYINRTYDRVAIPAEVAEAFNKLVQDSSPAVEVATKES